MFCLQFKSTTRDKKPRAENSVIRKHRGDVGTASAGGKQRQGSSGGQVRTGSSRTAAGVEWQQQSNSGQCGAAAKIHRRTVSHRRYKTHSTGVKRRQESKSDRIQVATWIERRQNSSSDRHRAAATDWTATAELERGQERIAQGVEQRHGSSGGRNRNSGRGRTAAGRQRTNGGKSRTTA